MSYQAPKEKPRQHYKKRMSCNASARPRPKSARMCGQPAKNGRAQEFLRRIFHKKPWRVQGGLFGRKVGPAIFSREDSLLFHKDHLIRAQNYYEKHGGITIVLARFMPI